MHSFAIDLLRKFRYGDENDGYESDGSDCSVSTVKSVGNIYNSEDFENYLDVSRWISLGTWPDKRSFSIFFTGKCDKLKKRKSRSSGKFSKPTKWEAFSESGV